MKLIKISNQLFFIVGQSKINEGDWCVDFEVEGDDRFFKTHEIDGSTLIDYDGFRHSNYDCLKITHSTGCFKGVERIDLTDVLNLIEHNYNHAFSEDDILRGIKMAREADLHVDDMIVNIIKKEKARVEWDVEFVEGVLDLKIN